MTQEVIAEIVGWDYILDAVSVAFIRDLVLLRIS